MAKDGRSQEGGKCGAGLVCARLRPLAGCLWLGIDTYILVWAPFLQIGKAQGYKEKGNGNILNQFH